MKIEEERSLRAIRKLLMPQKLFWYLHSPYNVHHVQNCHSGQKVPFECCPQVLLSCYLQINFSTFKVSVLFSPRPERTYKLKVSMPCVIEHQMIKLCQVCQQEWGCTLVPRQYLLFHPFILHVSVCLLKDSKPQRELRNCKKYDGQKSIQQQ